MGIIMGAIQKKTTSQYATENVVNETVKVPVENKNILDGVNDECENRFMQSNDEERCIGATEFQNSKEKRKRKQNLLLNDDVEENTKQLYKNTQLIIYTHLHRK